MCSKIISKYWVLEIKIVSLFDNVSERSIFAWFFEQNTSEYVIITIGLTFSKHLPIKQYGQNYFSRVGKTKQNLVFIFCFSVRANHTCCSAARLFNF